MTYKNFHSTAIIFCFFLFESCSSGPSKKILNSPNYKEGEFRNTSKLPVKSFWKFLGMRMKTDWGDWPDWVEIKPNQDIKPKVNSGLRITFINHSTMLIQGEKYNILTDPIFSKRCSPVSFMGPARHHAPGIDLEKLPPIDVILISHDHYDHLDLPTLETLIKRDNPKIFVGLGVKKRIESDQVIEMDWWESYEVSDSLKVNFTEVQHFSGRTLTDRNSTLWGGFLIELAGRKIYFGGDSGYGSHYLKTFEKYGSVDLAFLPIGAYAPRSYMKPMHMNPQEAVQAHLDLKASKSIGIHFGTFHLTAENRDEPQKLLKKEVLSKNLKPEEFVSLQVGKPINLP